MSKNHPHDNIYSILGKLDALKPTPEEKRFALVKEIRESVEAQGSIIEGVDAVQARLAKQFAETKTNEAIRIMGKPEGSPHKTAAYYHRGTEAGTSPEGQAHRNATAAMAKSARAAGGKLSMNRTTDPTGKRVHGGYDANAKGVTPFRSNMEEEQIDENEVCNECGMMECVCEGETTHKNGVTTHRKTDYPGYPDSDLDADDAEERKAGKKGRPRKAQTVKPRVDPNAPKKGRGRPKKDTSSGGHSFSGHDLFGRVKSTAHKTAAGKKGHVHSMDEAMSRLEQRFLRINEGINFAELLKEKHKTVDEMLAELSNDIKLFKQTGHCSELLKDCMEIKGYHGKMVQDEAIDPTNPRDYDIPAIFRKQAGQAPLTRQDVVNKDRKAEFDFHQRAHGKPHPDSLKQELDELARLAGLSIQEGHCPTCDASPCTCNEGNAFTGKLKATAKGEKFDLDGKEYTDTSTLDEEPNEGNAFGKAVRDAKADGVQPGEKVTVGGKTYPVKEGMQFTPDQEDKLHISTNLSDDGTKDVTISASGSKAVELLDILKLAGIGGQGLEQGTDDHEGDEEQGEIVAVASPEVDEAEFDEPATEPANSPDPEYASMRASTMGPGEGDAGEKAMHPDRPTKNNGDNALSTPATPPTRAQKTLIAVSALESKLAAEYESIKKVS